MWGDSLGKMSWWIPRWSFARRHVRGHRAVLRKISFTRVLLWGLVGSAAICALIKAKYPELDLTGLWLTPLAVVGLFACLGFNLVLVPILIPPHITVTGEGIRCSHHELGWAAKRNECDKFKIIVFSEGFRRLSFRCRGGRRSVGIAGSVDLNELRSLLPYPVKTIDVRKRFAAFQRGGAAARRTG